MKAKLMLVWILLANAALAQWTRINNSPSQASQIYFYNSSLGYALKGDKIYKTTDGGNTWNNSPTGLTTFDNIVDIYFVSPDTGFISVQNGMTFTYPVSIYKTLNGGSTWSRILGPFNNCEITFNIAGNNDWYFYLNTNMQNADTIYHTLNGGATWLNTPNANRVQYNQMINNLIVFKDSANTQNSTNLLYKSTDGGANWNLLLTDNTPASAFMDRQFLNSNFGYVLVYQYNASDNIPSKLYKTTDGGQNWVSFNLPVNCVAPQSVHFENTTTGYIVSHGSNQSTLFKTTDGGQSWNPDLTALASEYFLGSNGVSEYFGTLYILGNTIISKKLAATSANELKRDIKALKLFPNPSNGQLEIISASMDQKENFVITDLSGKEIFTFSMEQELSKTVDISRFNKGIYFLKNTESSEAIPFIKE